MKKDDKRKHGLMILFVNVSMPILIQSVVLGHVVSEDYVVVSVPIPAAIGPLRECAVDDGGQRGLQALNGIWRVVV